MLAKNVVKQVHVTSNGGLLVNSDFDFVFYVWIFAVDCRCSHWKCCPTYWEMVSL